MNREPQFSVIVPVYNVEKYLPRCIDSILSQTFTDFELLLIDDGSKDKSGSICDEYAQKDSRVRAFHKLNGGVSSARNFGLKNAHGKWICFCDSDDWVEKTWLEIFKKGDSYELVIQSFFAKNWMGRDSETTVQMPQFIGKYKQDLKVLFDLSYKYHNIGFIWCRAFKRNIINKNKIRFNIDYKIREDELFVFQYMEHVQSFIICPEGAYHYICPDYSTKYNETSLIVNICLIKDLIQSKESIIGNYDNKLILEDISTFSKYILKIKSEKGISSKIVFNNMEIFIGYVENVQNRSVLSFYARLLYYFPLISFFVYKLAQTIKFYIKHV